MFLSFFFLPQVNSYLQVVHVPCTAETLHMLIINTHISSTISNRVETAHGKLHRATGRCRWRTRAETQISSAPRVVVVGGGAGGLAAAGRLARSGMKVMLLEQRDVVGGRISSEYLYGKDIDVAGNQDGRGRRWRFDTGPSLLLFPETYRETFRALGAEMEDFLHVERISPAGYRVFFPSSPGFRIDLLNDVDAMSEQLEKLEQGAGIRYRRFLMMAKSNLDLGLPYFIDRDFSNLSDARGLLDLLPKLTNINPWELLGPHDVVMRSFFKDSRIRAAFTFQDLYVGLNPSSAPAVFSLLAATELCDGIHYPIGGFEAIRDAILELLESNGVEVRINSEVCRIDVGEDLSVKGVTLRSGEHVAADVVVCNRDLPAAYSLLTGDLEDSYEVVRDMNTSKTLEISEDTTEVPRVVRKHASARQMALRHLRYSAGVVEFNWAVRGKVPDLLHHNVFLSENFKKSWNPVALPSQFVEYPNFYVHVPSKTDPSAAPEGCDSIMVLLPVANMQQQGQIHSECQDDHRTSDVDYESLIDEGRRRVISSMQAANIPFSEDMIESEMVLSPPDWQARYGLQHGAAFGLSHGLRQLSLFRPAPKDPMIEGLYFVGASTRPGNGVPLCFIGAKLTANRIRRDLGFDD